MSIKSLVNKQIMAYQYSKTLLINKIECNIDTWNNMKEF